MKEKSIFKKKISAMILAFIMALQVGIPLTTFAANENTVMQIGTSEHPATPSHITQGTATAMCGLDTYAMLTVSSLDGDGFALANAPIRGELSIVFSQDIVTPGTVSLSTENGQNYDIVTTLSGGDDEWYVEYENLEWDTTYYVEIADFKAAGDNVMESNTEYSFTTMPNPAASVNSIYVNSTGGNDSRDGRTETNAVKTIAKAYELVAQHDATKIIVCGNTYFNATGTLSNDSYTAPAVPIKFEAINNAELTIMGYLVNLQADTTFRNITLVNNISNAMLVANGHTLLFDDGFELAELDQYQGTGLCITGGGYYGNDSLNLNIEEGGNIILKSGKFGGVYTGPTGGGASTNSVICTGIYRVYIAGDATVRDLYAGANWEMPSINSLTLPKSIITVDSDDVSIENIWAGGYWVAPIANNLQITQAGADIHVEAGTVGTIFAGGLGELYAVDSSYSIADVEIDISGTAQIAGILSGGVVIGSGGDDYTALERVENVTIKTSIDLSTTTLFSTGDAADIGYGEPSANEHVETGIVEVILTGNGQISELDVYNDSASVKDTDCKILTLDRITSEVVDGLLRSNGLLNQKPIFYWQSKHLRHKWTDTESAAIMPGKE